MLFGRKLVSGRFEWTLCVILTLTFAASAVPLRPIIAVYHHVRRIHHPMSKQGKWMHSEDESLLM